MSRPGPDRCGKRRVARLTRAAGLRALQPRRFPIRRRSAPGELPAPRRQSGKKSRIEQSVCRLKAEALRAVRAWLEPWILLWRYFRAWSTLPPPLELARLLEWVWQGRGINLYSTA